MTQHHTAWQSETRPPHQRPRTRVVVLGSEPIEQCFEGLDDTEVIAVQTVLELVGETGSIDTGVPDRVIACIAEACVTPTIPRSQPQEHRRIPRPEPIEPVIEALRVAEPGVRVVLVRTHDSESDRQAGGFDAEVLEGDDPETIRSLILAEGSALSEPPDQAPDEAPDQAFDHAFDETPDVAPDLIDPPLGPREPEPARGDDPIEAPERADTEPADPPTPVAAPPSPEPRSPGFSGGDAGPSPAPTPPAGPRRSDEQRLAAIAATGGDLRAEAVRLLNARWAAADPVGRTGLELRGPAHAAEHPGEALRVPVLWNGRTIGILAVVAGDDDAARAVAADRDRVRAALEEQADWLAPWLALSRRWRAMRRAATRDPLTGAYNRRYFLWYMDRAIQTARERRIPLTLLVFDIDHFKRYNDEFGHAAGDEILTESVKALRSVIRPTDRVCRIGGDEFAVIFFEPHGPRRLGSSPPEDVQVLARRVQERICRRRFPKLGEQARGRLTISGGLATYPWDGRDWRELLDHADELMLASKRQGKNVIKLGRGLSDICEPPGPEITVRPGAGRSAPNRDETRRRDG